MQEVSPTVGRGSILLADPFLLDPNFQRSVILVAEHNEDSVVGFVLNSPTTLKLSQAIESLTDIDVPLYLGGPVQPESLNFIHRLGDKIPDSSEIADGVFWGGDFELILELIRNDEVSPDDYRFFLGYAGWGSKTHLQRELEENSWFVTDLRRRYIFDETSRELWGTILKEMGGDYAMLVHAPPHPSLN